MEIFLKKSLDSNKFELVIDKNIFSKDIVLKAAYNFLDKWYFFFKLDESQNILLQFTPKDWIILNADFIINEFSDELLSVYLRDMLEQENKEIRERIVWSAIWNSLDNNNFVSLDTDQNNNSNNNQIDFDKDIDEILKEIENDPDLNIDEKEIEKILKEIEEETESEIEKPSIKIDMEWLRNAKKKFKK